MRVIVVGAGLLGASVAWHLARGGAEVTVLETGTPGGVASRTSFAWLNAQQKSPASYFELNRRGMEEHRRVAEALGDDTWLHGGGDLQVGAGEGASKVRAAAERHAALGYPVRLVDAAEATVLEPDLALPSGADAAFAWYEDEGWVDAAPLVGRLLGGVRAAGGSVRSAHVDAVIGAGQGRPAVRAGEGVLAADAVVLAAGVATEALAGTAGVRLPMAPTPGLLAVTSPETAGPRRVVHVGDVTLRPDGSGRALVASRAVDATLPKDLQALPPDAPEAARLLDAAARAYPGLAGARIEAVRIGRRSVAVDGMPVAGFADGAPGLYLLVSHSGATLAAILGRLAAQEVLGTPAPELEPYRMTAARAAGAAEAEAPKGPAGT